MQTMNARPIVLMAACCAPLPTLAQDNECAEWNSNGFFRNATVRQVAECVRTGVDLTGRGELGRTPLHVVAMYNKQPLVVTALVAAGANVRMRDRRDHTPLHSAAMANGNPVVMEALVAAGADPDTPSLPASMDDLIVPAGERSYSFYGFELWGTPWFFHNLEVNRDDAAGEGQGGVDDPIAAGALMGGENPTVFGLLTELATLTDPSVDPGTSGDGPGNASLGQSLGAMDELLEMLKARDRRGLRPVHLAARFNRSAEAVAALAKVGANMHARTVHDYNALHVAGGHGRSAVVVAALVKAGVDLEARDTSGGTPLHVAASASDAPAVVKALIDAGANLEAKDHQGRTPLHRAYGRFYPSDDVTDVLLAAGADPGARDSQGNTPSDLEDW